MLEEIVRKFDHCRLLVVGDLIADEFVYGQIARVSREAPVMILKYEKTETSPGGAANAAANVAALGGRVSICGITGRDRSGRMLALSLRNRGVDTRFVLSAPGYSTPTKTRILAGSVHSTRQQVIRIDREPETLINTDYHEKICQRLKATASEVDAIIVSDYNYGLVSPALAELLRKVAGHKPVVIDSRYRLKTLRGFTAATPNYAELEELIGRQVSSEAEIDEASERLRVELGLKALLLTRGGEGMNLYTENGERLRLRAVGSLDPVDVTGAGDTVIAAFALTLAAGGSYAHAAQIANHAGGLVVMKRGTATVSQRELIQSIKEHA